MKKSIIISLVMLLLAGAGMAQQGVAPTVIGCATGNSITGTYNIPFVIGQPIWSTIPASGYKTRCGFPYDASYLKNTFIGKFECSKGYFADYIALQWSIGSNTNKISKFVVSRRAYKEDGSNEYQVVASLDASTRSWQDVYAEASVLYEYKVYASGVYNLSDSLLLNYITGIGFRLPVGTATGRITYSGGTAVKGVTVVAETSPSPASYAAEFDGSGSGLLLSETNRASLTSANGFTFQAWAKDNNTNANDSSFLFDKGGVTSAWVYKNTLHFKYDSIGQVSLPLKNIAGAYFHVSAIRDLNTLMLVISTDDTTLVSKKTFTTYSSLVDKATGLHVGRSADTSNTYNWLGYIDEIRVWDKALTTEEIHRDYNRYIVGDEAGLSAYYQLNEGVGNTAYDLAHRGNKFNGNDAAMSKVSWTGDAPKSLGYKGVTDQDGNFIIARIPFGANGSTYKITPMLGVHKFEPSQALRFFSTGSTVSNNVDFTDKSSFTFNGSVYYDKSTFPVEGVTIMIDDNFAYKGRNLVATDAKGDFTVDVPIGFHKITLVKQGHVFSEGVFPPATSKDTVHDFQSNIVERVQFYDATTVLLTGRVAGGEVQANKPLGFALSKSNLGDALIELSKVKTLGSLRVTKETITEKINGDAKHTCSYTIEDNKVTVLPNKTTGEYALRLPPEAFIVNKVIAGDLSNVLKQTSFNANALGTVTLDLNAKDSSVYQKDSVTTKTYRFNKRYDFIHQVMPQIEVTQNETTLFGEQELLYSQEGKAAKDTVKLFDAEGNPRFGAPIFVQSNQYKMKISVFEQYLNKLTGETERIPVTNGVLAITNGLAKVKGVNLPLNQNGVVNYTFVGGEPNIVADYTQSFTILGKVFQGNDSVEKSISWGTGLKAIVLGGKGTGSNFVTTGPTNIICILRDPGGSGSFSYLEKGTTIVNTEETTNASVYNMETGMTAHLGLSTEIGAGIGVVVVTTVDATIDVGGGVKYSSTEGKGRATEQSYTSTERWETSSDPAYVGAMGDVFIGNSTNIVFGVTNNLTLVRDTTQKDTAVYNFNVMQGYSKSPEFNTAFRYSQNHITNYLIPNLESIRANFFVSQPHIYIPVDPSNPSYENKTIDLRNDTVFGDAYHYAVGVQLAEMKKAKPKDTVFFTEDSVKVYTRWIAEWYQVLADNEKAKVEAIKKNTLEKNHSFDAGTMYESSITTDARTAVSKTFSGETYGYFNIAGGIEVNGIGFSISTSHEFGATKEGSTTIDTTRSTTFGFVMSEAEQGDYLSIDAFHDKSGNGPIFRTRGGQTSCPYEGEIVAQYYDPEKKHILSVATMRVEVPEIDVDNNIQLDIPSTKPAVFDISLRNNSESGSNMYYELAVVDGTNPGGAAVKMDGGSISSGRSVLVPAGSVVKKKLLVEKGVADIMKYENIGIVLRSLCQSDPTDDLEDIADTIWITAMFVPSCTPVTLVAPLDKWTINTETDTTLTLRVSDFNKNDGNFVSVNLEYKPSSSSTWLPLVSYFPDTTKATYKDYNGTKAFIQGGEILHAWNMKSYEDRTYDVRAKSVCRDNIQAYSSVASGIKDTKRLAVFGTPQPTDGILSAGEDIVIRFNESIEEGIIQRNDITVEGVLNGDSISHAASLQLNGDTTYARANGFSFCEQSVTVEFWMQRDTGSKSGTIFAKGSGSERFEVEATSATTLRVWLDSVSHDVSMARCITAETPATAWHHFGFVFDRDEQTLTVYGDDKVLLDPTPVSFDPRGRGPVFVGCNAEETNFVKANIHDLRIWNATRNQGDVYANMYTQLTGNEANLLAYWTLDEGRGSLVIDRANANNLQLHSGWNISPRGNAVVFDGKNQALVIDGRSVVISQDRDATIEFWIKAAKPAKRTCVLYNGLKDSAANGKPASFGIYAEATGNLSVSSYGNTFTMVTSVLDNQWHHVALVLDRLSNIRSYVDGALQQQLDKSLIGNLNFVNMSLGVKRQQITADSANLSMYFAGSIDEVRVWQSARRAALIDMYRQSKLMGNESSLVLYYPFEAYVNLMGMKKLEPSLKDMTKPTTTADAAKVGSPSFTTTAPAVKDARPKQKLDVSFVVNNDQLLIQLPADMAARYENRTLEMSVENLQDKNGNTLASAAQWIAYVDKNTVVWDRNSVDLSTNTGVGQTFTAQVLNKGGASKSFIISNLPAWLTVNSQSGVVQPNSFTTLTFTVLAGVNSGDYQHKISLSSDYGYDELLNVNLSVKAKAPDWKVVPASYQYTMNVFGTVKINGLISDDESDMVAAFVGDECRGVTNLKYLSSFDATEAVIALYSNTERGDSITFLVWDASDGKIYSNVTPFVRFEADALLGSPDAPVALVCDNSLRTEYALSKGWNWLSVNVVNPRSNSVQNLFAAVGSEGDEIKGHRSVFDKYSSVAGWSGSLTASGGISPREMYKMKLSKAGVAKINGTPVDPKTTTLDIAAGWNWLGFVPQYNMTIGEALASYSPVAGDIVKSQKTFSMYYDRIGWVGTLNVLEPGKGYMLKSAKASTLIYPQQSSLKSTPESHGSLNFRGYDASAFQSNMTIVASLSDNHQYDDGKIVVAYNGSTVVGVSSRCDEKFFIVAGGNTTAQTLTFALVDTLTGQRLDFENQLAYSTDGVQGTIDAPYLLTSKTSLDAANVNNTFISVTPTVFSNKLTVSASIAVVTTMRVRVLDVLGRELCAIEQAASTISLDEIATTLAPGTYSVEVTTGNEKVVTKVVK